MVIARIYLQDYLHIVKSIVLVTVIGHQFITLSIDICVQHDGREELHRMGLSVAVETCIQVSLRLNKLVSYSDQYGSVVE